MADYGSKPNDCKSCSPTVNPKVATVDSVAGF